MGVVEGGIRIGRDPVEKPGYDNMVGEVHLARVRSSRAAVAVLVCIFAHIIIVIATSWISFARFDQPAPRLSAIYTITTLCT